MKERKKKWGFEGQGRDQDERGRGIIEGGKAEESGRGIEAEERGIVERGRQGERERGMKDQDMLGGSLVMLVIASC